MKKNIILWLAVSVVVMLALPWLAATLIGAFAGKDVKHLWSFPIVSAVLFLIGTWIFFDMGETAFILYAVVYFVLGIVAMLIRKKTKKVT